MGRADMRNTILLSIVVLALLQPVVEALFLGPVAVGAAIGAIALGKGFLLGSFLSRGRSYKQSYRQRRDYTPYRRSHHYNPQRTYYYPSHRYYSRGKRVAPEIDMAELERYKREVVDKVLSDEWYMDMVEKDQDDCTKRLICEVSHKQSQGKKLNTIEGDVMEVFGKGTSVDTSKSTAIFDFAAQAGKYWKKGGVGCDFYRRCETPVSDILAMIETELDDFEKLEQDMNGSKANAESEMNKEKADVVEMINSLDPDLVIE